MYILAVYPICWNVLFMEFTHSTVWRDIIVTRKSAQPAEFFLRTSCLLLPYRNKDVYTEFSANHDLFVRHLAKCGVRVPVSLTARDVGSAFQTSSLKQTVDRFVPLLCRQFSDPESSSRRAVAVRLRLSDKDPERSVLFAEGKQGQHGVSANHPCRL